MWHELALQQGGVPGEPHPVLQVVAGRTDRPRDVEEAVWAREETYSTGLGFGFAVPHCLIDLILVVRNRRVDQTVCRLD